MLIIDVLQSIRTQKYIYKGQIQPKKFYYELYASFQGRNYDNAGHYLKKAINLQPELSKKERFT